MRDRTKVTLLAIITVPVLWVTFTGGSDASPQPVVSSSSTPAAPTPAGSGSPAPSASPVPASPSATPLAASALPGDPAVVQHGDGHLTIVPGSTKASGPGRLWRYTVSVEGGLGVDAAAFAAQVDSTLADPRSWGHAGTLAFRRVDSGPVDIKVVLASPVTTDQLCRPLDTAGIYSCGNGSTAVLNSMRWLQGADAYAGRLPDYRLYVVNHEVGHTIGHGHEQCGGAGQLAPVMMQQTKGVGACLPSPWPFP